MTALRGSRRLAWAASASLALHAAVLAGLLPRRGGGLPEEQPRLEVELIDEAAQRRGDAASAAAGSEEQPADPSAALQPPPEAAETSPEPTQPTAPPTELGQGGVPMPLPYRPPPQLQASAAPSPGRSDRPEAPQVNLGDEEDREGLRVSGDDVVPPQPDGTQRNQPPRYPQDAARRGAQGTVQLRVRVTEAGRPLTTMVARSSGDASLDRSAMDAVMRWRFTPAKRGGVAVPFDYFISIRFVIGDG